MSKLAQEYFATRRWRYFLQGSRSKGYHTPQSDWDYYLDDEEHSRKTFRYMELFQEWVVVADSVYMDNSTTMVFEKFFLDGKVQVSCRKDFDFMCRAWEGVSPEFYGKYLNKRSMFYLGKEFTKDFVNNLYFPQLDSTEWINE